MISKETQNIIYQIWTAQRHLSNLEESLRAGIKEPEDLMDHVNLAEQSLIEIESLLTR